MRQPEGRAIHQLVSAIGLKTAHADGNDPLAVYDAARTATDWVRGNSGPYFLELTTYRWREHCGPNYDNSIGYRTEEEFLMWKDRDPIPRFEEKLLSARIITAGDVTKMDDEINAEIRDAFDFAEQSPFPSSSEAFEGLFAPSASRP